MSKFNLKNYQKINGDDHIDRKLQDQHENPKNSITEDQLSDRRVEEKEVILEKLLENKRVGSAEVIIEKNLNDSKGMFAPLRNSETYSGNINKVEEKRLEGDKMEDEKYETSSKVPKEEKWWNHLASDSSKLIVTAGPKIRSKNPLREVLEDDRMDKFTPEKGFELAKEMGDGDEANEGLVPDRGDVGNEFIGNEENQSVDEEIGSGEKVMEIVQSKISEKPIPSMRFQLKFDPNNFDNDSESIKEEALNMILTRFPNLQNKISIDDFNEPTMKGPESLISMVLIGPEYFKKEDEEMFSNLNIEESDEGGTPITLGRVKLSPFAIQMATEDKQELINLIEDYIVEQEPSLAGKNIGQVLNFSAITKGEVTFVIGDGIANEESDMGEPQEEFPIEEHPIEEQVQEEFPIEEENTITSASDSTFQKKISVIDFKQKKN